MSFPWCPQCLQPSMLNEWLKGPVEDPEGSKSEFSPLRSSVVMYRRTGNHLLVVSVNKMKNTGTNNMP